MDETPVEIARKYTQGVQFPASKDDVIAALERNGAPADAVELVRAGDHAWFASPNDVQVILRQQTGSGYEGPRVGESPHL